MLWRLGDSRRKRLSALLAISAPDCMATRKWVDGWLLYCVFSTWCAHVPCSLGPALRRLLAFVKHDTLQCTVVQAEFGELQVHGLIFQVGH